MGPYKKLDNWLYRKALIGKFSRIMERTPEAKYDYKILNRELEKENSGYYNKKSKPQKR